MLSSYLLRTAIVKSTKDHVKPINTQQTLWISVRVEVVNYPDPFLAGVLILQAINAHTKKGLAMQDLVPLWLSTMLYNMKIWRKKLTNQYEFVHLICQLHAHWLSTSKTMLFSIYTVSCYWRCCLSCSISSTFNLSKLMKWGFIDFLSSNSCMLYSSQMILLYSIELFLKHSL